MTTHTFAAGDVINLKGGTYRIATNGFSPACVTSADSNGVGTILPLPFAGANGNPIIIQNAPGEEVILDATTSNMAAAAWTACGTSSWQTTRFNVGSARTNQIWINPSGAMDPGTRLTWSNATDCNGMAPGTFRSSGATQYVRLPNSGSANGTDFHMSCQNGDCAWQVIGDTSATAYVTVRRNPSGGSITGKYGYYGAHFNNGAHHVTLDGVNFVGCGGRDYGSCVRIANGNNITVMNGTVREVMGEGVALYGGGPGADAGIPGIQISGNVVQNMDVSDTGFAFKDGGGNGQNNLGMGIIVKNCSNCSFIGNRIHRIVAVGIHVTTSRDFGLESAGILIDGNEIYDYGYLYGGQGRTSTAINLEPQNDAAGASVRNITIVNNMIHNETFSPNQGESPEGIVVSPSGHAAPTGIVVANNSFRNLREVCLDIQQTSAPITFRNNAFQLCGLNNSNSGLAVYSSSTPHVHSNNTYWSANGSDNVVWAAGGVTRANVIASWEPTAMQADPQFTSASNLKPLPGSPLIDAGTNTNCPTVDRNGASRPSGARCDIGAFEGAGTGSGVTTPRAPTNLRVGGSQP